MDVEEVLKLADDLVFAKTGKHLNHLQEGILRGTWQRQKYPEIATNCHRSEAHVTIVWTLFLWPNGLFSLDFEASVDN
ncbi:hypothetical protein [Microcoleus sp. K5-D4]|uniref:hypothetical protein n=1 Tax=Microcoleus sp. K5-D4 TaxID=2818801 RepID=UPI004040C97B